MYRTGLFLNNLKQCPPSPCVHLTTTEDELKVVLVVGCLLVRSECVVAVLPSIEPKVERYLYVPVHCYRYYTWYRTDSRSASVQYRYKI